MIQTLVRDGLALRVVDIPLCTRSVMSTLLLYLCTHDIKPHRGCHWLIQDDVFLAVAFKQNAMGVYTNLDYLSLWPSRSWDLACYDGVDGLLFWERCQSGFPALAAIDDVPWEIHKIKDLTAHVAALEAYDQARP